MNTLLHERDTIRTLVLQGNSCARPSVAERTPWQLMRQADSPPKFVVLDFSGVSYMDSSAIECLRKIPPLVETRKFDTIIICCSQRLAKPLKQLEIVTEAEKTERRRVNHLSDLDQALCWCEDQILASTDPAAQQQEKRDKLAALLRESGKSAAGATPETALSFLMAFAEHYQGEDMTSLLPLLQHAEFGSHPEGVVLMDAAMESVSIFVVVEGTVTWQSSSQSGVLTPGVLFGLEEFFGGSSSDCVYRSASDPCTVAQLSSATVSVLESEDPGLAHQFHQLICHHLASRLQSSNSRARIVDTEVPVIPPAEVVESVVESVVTMASTSDQSNQSDKKDE